MASPSSVTLRFSLTIEIAYPEKNDEYSVHIFPSHQPFQTTVYRSYTFSQGSTMVVDIVLTPPFPDRLWFELYIWSDSDDGDRVFSETPEGTGFLPLLTVVADMVHTVTIKDADNKAQGVLRVKWIPDMARPIDRIAMKKVWQHSIVNRDPQLYVIDRNLVSGLQVLYDELQHSPELQNYFTFTTPIGNLPILCWSVLLCNSFYESDSVRSSDTLRMMEHLMRLSCASLQIKLEDVPSCDDTEMANLVGEVLSWVPRCLLYVADFERRANRKIHHTDYWSRPLTYPVLGMVGCDCEDVNGGVIAELGDRLQHLHVWMAAMENATLSHAQKAVMRASEFLFDYAVVFSMGSLRTGQRRYEAHAHTCFLDRRYIARLINDAKATAPTSTARTTAAQYLPAIVPEGTNWFAGAWDRQQMDAVDESGQVDEKYNRAEEFFQSAGPKEVWLRRLLRTRVPASEVRKHHAYGVQTALLIPQYIRPGSTSIRDATALHLILRDASHTTMGRPTEELLLYQSTSDHVVVHAQLDYDYIRHIKWYMCDFPVSKIPVCSLTPKASEGLAQRLLEQRRKSMACVSGRTQDANQWKMTIAQFTKSAERLHIPVTDDCSLTEFYV